MAHVVDTYVGARIRRRRWMLGVTQQQVASRIGVQFQQLQKYETGTNRVSASRLWEISKALEVPTSYFFEGIGDESSGTGDPLAGLHNDHKDKETMALVNAYYAMPETHRRKLLELARALGEPAARAA